MQNHPVIQHYTSLTHETVGLLIHLNQEWLTNKLIQELYFKHNTLTGSIWHGQQIYYV